MTSIGSERPHARPRARLRAKAHKPTLQFVKHCARVGNEMVNRDTCPVCRTAEIVCGKWTLLVIRELAEGRSRFCELERSLAGISPRTLSLRLRALEEEGIVERQTYPEVPPRVEYVLTDKGRALVPLIEDMRIYGREWLGVDCGDVGEADVEVREPAVAIA
jgi:DNA-binding HxlR family transcriptional regulator